MLANLLLFIYIINNMLFLGFAYCFIKFVSETFFIYILGLGFIFYYTLGSLVWSLCFLSIELIMFLIY